MATKTKARIQVTIERETAKAVLVAAGDQRAWVQRRWHREDGTVAAGTFARQADEYLIRERMRQTRQAEHHFRADLHRVEIAKQTDAAIAVEILISFAGVDSDPALVWFAKSICERRDDGAYVPGWLIREREQEVQTGATLRGAGSTSYERHRFCKGERPAIVRGVVPTPSTDK